MYKKVDARAKMLFCQSTPIIIFFVSVVLVAAVVVVYGYLSSQIFWSRDRALIRENTVYNTVSQSITSHPISDSPHNKQLLDEVEQNIVICQWQ